MKTSGYLQNISTATNRSHFSTVHGPHVLIPKDFEVLSMQGWAGTAGGFAAIVLHW